MLLNSRNSFKYCNTHEPLPSLLHGRHLSEEQSRMIANPELYIILHRSITTEFNHELTDLTDLNQVCVFLDGFCKACIFSIHIQYLTRTNLNIRSHSWILLTFVILSNINANRLLSHYFGGNNVKKKNRWVAMKFWIDFPHVKATQCDNGISFAPGVPQQFQSVTPLS